MNILSYNICGLKNKIKDKFFLDFLNNYDIFCLLETFIEENHELVYSNYFQNYKLLWVSATRMAKFGRAIGGILICCRTELITKGICKFITINNVDLLQIKVSSNFCLHVWPIYLGPNKWKENFCLLEALVNDNNNLQFLLLGDWNGRLGDGQAFEEDTLDLGCCAESRGSKDNIVNSEGKLILDFCDDHGFLILNGRSPSDMVGEFTYLGPRGSSVIDFALVSVSSVKLVKDFSVRNVIWSDHMAIDVIIQLELEERKEVLTPNSTKLIWNISKCIDYKHNLEKRIETCENIDLEVMKDIIRDSAKCMQSYGKPFESFQPWFDRHCFKNRTRVFKLLNLFRKTRAKIVQEKYIAERRKYFDLCEQKRKSYYLEAANAIKNSKNSSEFWTLVNKFKKRGYKCGDNIDMNIWVNHFSELFNPRQSVYHIHYAAPLQKDDNLDCPFNINELLCSLDKFKNGKAPGIDGIMYEFYKFAPKTFLELLLELINNYFDKGSIPDSMNEAVVLPLFKKGDPNQASNYRGIVLQDTIKKVYTSLLAGRLKSWVQEKKLLCEEQAGFREGYSTMDNIFVLTNVIQLKWNEGVKKIYCFFIDFKSAFDSVNRHALLFKLSQLGVSTKFIRAIASLYSSTKLSVSGKRGRSTTFPTISGVQQGCNLSPLLFTLFVNDIKDCLSGGIWLRGYRIKLLLFADDIVFLADNALVLQNMINELEYYVKDWNLQVNLSKSNIMVFRKGGGKLSERDSWMFNNQPVKVVNRYKYLGITLSPSLTLTDHFNQTARHALLGLNCVWNNLFLNKHIPLLAKSDIFKSVTRSILTYGSQVWGYRYADKIESVQRTFIKKIFKLPRTTPNYMIYLEAKISPIHVFTFQLQFKYILKTLDLDEERLTKLVAEEVIKKKLLWFKEWINWAEKVKCNFNPVFSSVEELGKDLKALKSSLINYYDTCYRERALNGQYHQIYKQLSFDIDYINSNLPISDIGVIIKIRGELLNLNYRPFIQGQNYICSMCNIGENEDVFHYLGRCKVLEGMRKKYFGVATMTEIDMVKYLNGEDWAALVGYLKEAYIYRSFLIQNFNY